MCRVLRVLIGLCLLVLAGATDTSGAQLPLSIPFDFESNQILLKVSINGTRPGWFILDSGASGCIVDTTVARRLHIKTEGQAQGTGAGHGPVAITFANSVTYSLPGTSLTVPRSYVIDFSNQPALLGHEIAGVLGYEFFIRYVVALDFEARVMTLYDPATYTPPTGATTIPFTITRKTPYIIVRTKVEGADPVETIVQIDSGSGDSFDVDNLARSPHRLETLGGVGSGQEFRMVMGRGEWAELGPFRFPAPTGATGGVQLIGLQVLRRFDVVFDYTHSRMLLTPNSRIAEPFGFDASGLDIRWSSDGKHFVAHDVPPDTPAAQAGIRTNDEILTINNQPADRFTIGQFMRMLSKDGETVVLGIRRGNMLRVVNLTLRKRL
jgi:Aspartyl protease/PDZ domain